MRIENEPIWLTAETPDAIELLLRQRGLLAEDELLASVGSAGDGNMNVTLRVRISGSGHRSLIVKQSRPFVAKYDFIPAPIERANFESQFYRFAGERPSIAQCMPRLIDWIADEYVLVLEDLGEAADATTLYAATPEGCDQLLGDMLPPLVHWLSSLYSASYGNASCSAGHFDNIALRRLNHQHIFVLPFRQQPAIDLDAVTPGLADASLAIRTDEKLVEVISGLGKQYLSRGQTLLHGDFYPGSWLQTDNGPKVIDPEFCFAGPAEFDWSVLVAHLTMCGVADGLGTVRRSMEESPHLDWALVSALAGVEVLRRLLGVAQLPLRLDLAEKERLMTAAADDVRALRHSSAAEKM